MAATIGQDGIRILELIYDDPTTPLWLREIPVIETLRITWIPPLYSNGEILVGKAIPIAESIKNKRFLD